MKNGKIVFNVINILAVDGEKEADKYEIAWSSLVLDKNGKAINLNDMAFNYAKS